MREQFGEAMHRMRSNAREHIAEPGERLHPATLAHGDEAHQYGRRLAAMVTAKECPVAAADRDVSTPSAVQQKFCTTPRRPQGGPSAHSSSSGTAFECRPSSMIAKRSEIFFVGTIVSVLEGRSAYDHSITLYREQGYDRFAADGPSMI